MDVPKLLYSKRETAQLLSLSIRTVEALIVSQQLIVRRVGKRVLVTRTSIVDFAGATGNRIRSEQEVAGE